MWMGVISLSTHWSNCDGCEIVTPVDFASHLFQRRMLERDSALVVAAASEMAAAHSEIGELQWVLSKNTLENEILKDAEDYAVNQKWNARSPLTGKDDRR